MSPPLREMEEKGWAMERVGARISVSFLSFSKSLCVCQSRSMGYTQFVHGLIGSEACRVGSRGGRMPAM